MSGFLYRGRDGGAVKRARPKSLGPVMDFTCEETDKGPPLQMHSLREFEQHLNDLKKENFSLKLRIYFLEEKIQQKFEESSDDVHKRNIELKVEVESLKKDLEEKQQLLDEALVTAESLTNQNEAELQRRLTERQQEISHMQEILETKVQLLQKEAQLARGEAERMASMADSESQRCLALEREMVVRLEESGDTVEPINRQNPSDKDSMMEKLKQKNRLLGCQVEELEVKVHDLSSSLQKKEEEAERLIEEQRGRLGQYEAAAGQCVSELHQAQDQVHSLQAKIRQSETRNQMLQRHLADMEPELRSAREEAQQQESNVQNISDSLRSKEAEVVELLRVIDEQNKMLCSLKELANRTQVSGSEGVRGQGEVLALQASLFQAQLELQANQRAQRQAARTQEDQSRAVQRLETDLQGALQHRRETERHNQELQSALQEARSALQEREEQLSERDRVSQAEKEDSERTARELRTSLQTKERLLQDCCELLEQHQNPHEKRDSLLQKLRQRIRERDRTLERAVDEKFRCMEEKEEETRGLQLLLREKERDLERQRCVLNNNDETISSLEVLLRGKTLELEQVGGAYKSIQQQQQESERRQSHILRERDAVISQLQGALHACTQEAEDLRSSLLAQIQSVPSNILEELKVRLQLKDHLFQEVLADRTRQTQEHQEQVQDLLHTISSRDQYVQEAVSRFGELMAEQATRLQELRRQLNCGVQASELQALQDELRLALKRQKESEDQSTSQAAQLDSLIRTLHGKDDIIRGFQSQTADPSDLLAQRIHDLRENVDQQVAPPSRDPALQDGPDTGLSEFGELSSEVEDEAGAAADDVISEYSTSIDEDESKLSMRALMKSKVLGGAGTQLQYQNLRFDGPVLTEVKQLVDQKRAVDRELSELRAQLEKAGFSSLSQMRKALFTLQAENDDLKHQLSEQSRHDAVNDEQKALTREEEELNDIIEGTKQDDDTELWQIRRDDHCQKNIRITEAQWKNKTSRTDSLHLANHSQDAGLGIEPAEHLQRNKELQERLMVSEATVQFQTQQLKDYRELLTEMTVRRDNKQIQVDLQDLGYETCGRSENEAEREDTSSPEFDDLEMCTSLDCGSQWWPSSSSAVSKTQSPAYGDEVSSLRRLVEDLRAQLSRSQGAIRRLQSCQNNMSTSAKYEPPAPRKVNWSFQVSPSHSGAEDDEGWQSSDGGPLPSPYHSVPDKDLQELVSRVDALEDHLRKSSSKMSLKEDGKSAGWSRKFDRLIQAQARELSNLRQWLQEGRGVCHILTQHLGDTTKAFEDLLRANDIDYYMGQSFREQLEQGSSLAQRVSAKISGRDHPENPEDKTELLAIWLSKELQQKDKVIESLRAKLNQHDDPHRSDTPCSSHAFSAITDQSDRISYVSDEQGSTNENLELCSDVDGASELGQEETRLSARVSTDCHAHCGTASCHASVPPSIASSRRSHSCFSCPSMHCCSHRHADVQSHTGFLAPQSKPLPGVLTSAHQHSGSSVFLPLSCHGFQPSPFSTGNLDAASAMKSGANLLDSSALRDMTYGPRAASIRADVSSGSSGYQSGPSHTGSDLMKEHLREIRSLRQRLEDSIQTNDRLRQQLEDKLAHRDKAGAPTNIYIQGLDSASQLSSEVRILKEENVSLQNQLTQATKGGSKEVEQLQEMAILEQARLKEAELETEKWAEQSRQMQAEAEAHSQEISQLKQERERNRETINRLQSDLGVVQQQLSDSRSLVQSLQGESHFSYKHASSVQSRQAANSTVTFDPRAQHSQLEQQLMRRNDASPQARRQLFIDNVPSPPVKDTGFIRPCLPVCPEKQHGEETKADNQTSSAPQGQAPDASCPSSRGRHMVGLLDDFKALQQQILDGSTLLQNMETSLKSWTGPDLQERSHHQVLDSVTKFLDDTKTLRDLLEEADSLLRMFWRTDGPDTEETKQDQRLRDEITSLRLRLSERDRALRDTVERVKSANRTKDSMEHFIVSQLSRTRDVLQKAKTNLEENKLRISSFHRASFALPPPFLSSLSSRPWLNKGEDTACCCKISFPPGWDVLRPHTSSSSSSLLPGAVLHQRTLQAATQ
ncbi:myomegalin isoform X2 [Thalassophryne amazonica]|uniref:myomegalin isoform X2 n=1 Tax=Thalassophryne amazonica TaxID=390379 RepID=UPI001471CB30|nr:myomegalin isoform X2 [Thalassophryne amazonica]